MNRLLPLLYILPLLFTLSGCVSQQIAKRVLLAPSKQPGVFQNEYTEGFKALSRREGSSFHVVDVPVGKDGESIQTLIIPPRNYSLMAENTYTTEETRKGDTVTIEIETSMSFQYEDGKKNKEPFLKPKGTIYVLHGYGGNKELLLPLGLIIAAAGYQTVLVDLRGHGESSGNQIGFGLKEVQDLNEVRRYIHENHEGFEQVGVLGYSYGSVMAIQWAAQDPRVQSVVAMAPYNHPEKVMRSFIRSAIKGIGKTTIDESVQIVENRLGTNWDNLAMETFVATATQPMLFIRGEADRMSTQSVIDQLSDQANGKRSSLRIDHADHDSLAFWFNEIRDPILNWFEETYSGSYYLQNLCLASF
jgi:pimeloyl-ACP methyl ester carboxylesterase